MALHVLTQHRETDTENDKESGLGRGVEVEVGGTLRLSESSPSSAVTVASAAVSAAGAATWVSRFRRWGLGTPERSRRNWGLGIGDWGLGIGPPPARPPDSVLGFCHRRAWGKQPESFYRILY